MWQFWLIAAGIFFIAEMITVGFLIFWLGIGALLAMIVSFFTDSILVQAIVFVVTSALLMIFTKPLVKKYVKVEKEIPMNAYSIIGKKAIVTQEIDSTLGTGQITISGDIWSAESANEEKITKGTKVKIISIEGVKAVVQPIHQSEILKEK